MSNYIYYSDLPETSSHIPEVPTDKKKKGMPRRIISILCICLFIAIAGLAFAAVVFLSGSFVSEDETNDTNAAWEVSASCSEITGSDLLY